MKREESYRARESDAAEHDEHSSPPLPRAGDDEPAEAIILPVATETPAAVAEAEPITPETLRAALEQRRAELSTLEGEQAEVRAELRRVSEQPEAFTPEEIVTLRRRDEEIGVSLSLGLMQERAAQLLYYAGLIQSAEWRQGGEIEQRERLASELQDLTARFESAQRQTAGTAQELHDLRQFYFRVEAELAALRVEFRKSLSVSALRAPMPPRQNLNESVRRELASIGYTKGL